MQEKRLIQGIRAKDEEAFNEIYYKYHDLVYYVVLKIVKNRDDASDVTEDTFLKMYNKIDQYNGGNFKYWLLQIAKHEALNFVTRVASKRKEVSLNEELVNDAQDDTFSLGKYDDLLKDNFDEEARTIIILKVVFDYTYDEIAKELNLSRSYVYRCYKLSISKLKNLMEVRK